MRFATRNPSLYVFLALALSCLLLGRAAHVAAQPTDSRAAKAELKQTEQEISQLKKLLGSLKQEMSGLERELKGSETEIGRLRRESDAIEKQILEGETRLEDLRRQAKQLQVALEAQQEQIARQVRAAYVAGRQDYLKMVLNQNDPARVARMMRYYGYVSRARVAEIERYTDTLEQIRAASAQIAEQQAALQADREKLTLRERELAAEREKRSKVLASLQGRSQTQQQKIRNRESERAELAALIKKLDAAITNIATPAGSLPFAQAKGKLPLPVAGQIRSRFGSQRGSDSRLKWDGFLMTAKEGARVHAVHGGRVVFADWLRGSGLLLILDHGNGYLSLYGHNQTLLRDVGTWVQPGEAIATVGTSGGLGEPSLYFSIRHKGRALDPAAWCKLSS